MHTFTEVLDAQLRADAGRPFITYYRQRPEPDPDERVELSVTTYANWVAKAASLLVEEHDLERGDTLRIDLPPHWLGAIFLGAAWSAGLAVTDGPTPDAVVCGPDSLHSWAQHAADLPVLACALLPLGTRFAESLPPGVHDVGVDIWSQPDSFVAWDPATGDDDAYDLDGQRRTQAELWSAAAAGVMLDSGGRLLSGANPASPPGVATVTEPLLGGGSLILVAEADAEFLAATYVAERATARFLA